MSSLSNITLGLIIGASLASSFNNSIGTATKSVSQLQEKSEGLRLKTKVGQQYLDLQHEIDKTGVKFEATGYKSVTLGRRLVQLEKSAYTVGMEAKNLGFNLNVIDSEMKKVTIETQLTEKAISRMQMAAARKAELGNLKMQLMGLAGIGYMVSRSFSKAVETEQAQFRLSTVINTDEKNKTKAMKEAKQAAADVAQSGLAGFNDAFNIQYALNSAGLTAQLSKDAAHVVASVAKLTGGMHEQVGEVLATNYNNLGSRLKGSEAEKFARIGDLLTKVQYKYQIRDFSQLGEGMKYAATAVNQYNINLEQSYAAIGELNSAGLQSGMAGTGFSAMMRQLQIGASKGLISIKRTKDGQIDLVKTLEQIKKKTDHMSADKKASFIQKLAGDEGARALVPLMKNLDAFRENVKDVTVTSNGIVGKGISDWGKTSEAGIMKLNGALEVTSFSLKEGFLPIIGEVAANVAPIVVAFGTWAQQNPETVKMIGSVIAGFYGMKAIMIVGRMAILGIANAFSVIMAHPIVFGLVAIGLIAYKIWKNWDFLKGKLLQFWDGIKTTWSSIGDTLKGFFSPFFTWIDEKVEWIIGKWTAFKNLLSIGHNMMNVSAGKGSNKGAPQLSIPGHVFGGIFSKPHVAAISEGGKKEAVIPLEGNRERAKSIYTETGRHLGMNQPAELFGSPLTITNNITINAPAATDAAGIAREVCRQIAEAERRARVRERGRFVDAPVFG